MLRVMCYVSVRNVVFDVCADASPSALCLVESVFSVKAVRIYIEVVWVCWFNVAFLDAYYG